MKINEIETIVTELGKAKEWSALSIVAMILDDAERARKKEAVVQPCVEWVEWDGDTHCPVAGYARTTVRFRNGTEHTNHAPQNRVWWHTGGETDIIAYKVEK